MPATAKPLTLNGKTWKRPENKKFKVQLGPNREALITISYGIGTVPVKLYTSTGYFDRHLVRENGVPKTTNVKCKAVTIKCKVTGTGKTGEVTANSYCKPPDTFSSQTGVRLATKHLFAHDSQSEPMLSGKDRKLIIEATCPWLFKKVKATATPAVPLAAAAK